jgi:hypothetical protein
MKIKTSEKDKLASAEIYYNPSKYFKMAAEEYGLGNESAEDNSIHNQMGKNIAIFIDMLEIVNMDFNASEVCFSKAIEGLIRGMAIEISLNYDNEYDEKMPLEELLSQVKRRVYKDRKYMAENDYFMEEGPEEKKSKTKNNVLKLIKKNR